MGKSKAGHLVRHGQPEMLEHGREHVDGGLFRSAICDVDANQDVIGVSLCILDLHVKVAALAKDSRVNELVLGGDTGAGRRGAHETVPVVLRGRWTDVGGGWVEGWTTGMVPV